MQASSSIVSREITSINAGIGICIVAIKAPPLTRHGAITGQRGDAFVISRSHSVSLLFIASSCAGRETAPSSLLLFDPLTPDDAETSPLYVLRRTIDLRPSCVSAMKLFLKRDSLTRRAFLPLLCQTAFRISIYTPLVSGAVYKFQSVPFQTVNVCN